MQEEEDQEVEHPVRNLVLSVCDLQQKDEHGRQPKRGVDSDCPRERCGAQAVTFGTRIYLHGGCDGNELFGDLNLLQIEHMVWKPLPTTGPAPTPRWGHTMQGYNQEELVVFGGLVAEAEGLLTNEPTGAPQGGPQAPPFARGLPWTVSGAPDNSFHTLQTSSLVWQAPTCGGSPPSPRLFHSACLLNDLYVIFGGSADAGFTQPLRDLHWLDLRSKQWTSPTCGGEAPSARFGHKMVSGPDDQVFVFGGAGGPTSVQAMPGTLYAFKLATSTWSVVQVGGTPPLERSFHSFDVIGKWAFAFAGSTASSTSDLYILDIPNMRWARPLYEGSINVRSHASSVLHDKLIVFGGVRDKESKEKGRGPPVFTPHMSHKLFFLNVLEVKGGVAEGDFKFKLVTVGDSGVGKSCLLTRFVQDFYSDFHVSTIGVDFKTVITMVGGKLVKLQLWDTAGQERFSVVTGNYYRNSDGFVFVYDATNRASFDHVEQWMGQVQQHHECGPTTVKILVGNKADMAGDLVVTEEEGRAKADSIGAFFIQTSAKTAVNVDMAFLTAAQQLVQARQRQKQQPKNVPSSSHIGSLGSAGSGAGRDKAKCACGGGGGGGGRGR